MDALRAEAVASERQQLRERAIQAGERLIRATENLLSDRGADESEFLDRFNADATEFLHLLTSLDLSLSTDLCFFRGCPDVRPDKPDGIVVETFTELGFPVYSSPEGGARCFPGLVCEWYHLFKMFLNDLRLLEVVAIRTGKKCSSGGRPKDPEVLRLQRRIAEVIEAERFHLERNADVAASVLPALRAFSTRDWVRRVNDRFGKSYPLTGAAGEKIRKQVARSDAWRVLHGELLSRTEAPAGGPPAPKQDVWWAMENSLHITR